jgi:hypothetical protein
MNKFENYIDTGHEHNGYIGFVGRMINPSDDATKEMNLTLLNNLFNSAAKKRAIENLSEEEVTEFNAALSTLYKATQGDEITEEESKLLEKYDKTLEHIEDGYYRDLASREYTNKF